MTNGGEFDHDSRALDMDYLEATGKYLQGRVPRSALVPILENILDPLSTTCRTKFSTPSGGMYM